MRSARPDAEFALVPMSTRGDRNKAAPLLSMERGMFVKDIEAALLNGDIDIAVHSAKDLPAAMPPGLAIVAYTEREDPRDVLVGKRGLGLDDLPHGARVGTSSPRRAAQLKAKRPDLALLPVRGNVGTRIRKAFSDEYDAVVLAAAGVVRLGRQSEISAFIHPEVCVPDVGQGALAVQIRAGDADIADIARAADHHPTSAAVRAERAVVDALGGGCAMPTAAYARLQGGALHIIAMVARPDGSEIIRASETLSADDPEAAGRAAAAALTRKGAARILAEG